MACAAKAYVAGINELIKREEGEVIFFYENLDRADSVIEVRVNKWFSLGASSLVTWLHAKIKLFMQNSRQKKYECKISGRQPMVLNLKEQKALETYDPTKPIISSH
ncbi:sterile alpha motif (SAM) domain-containing protein [Striga asiatica]|uniref:Sterile alpha motif (SAM) domain-containing protein n=1 Tax=Striga asiatica TaxID=4170 RepID=A0A5A7QTJ7_STRAF|nr:sterile alpha motif (SAM) domain-containing protein [Striga asiatica]